MTGHGEITALFRPGEAGAAIGIKPSTLRVYAQRFTELLSEEATAEDRPGYRFYTQRDVEVLKKARELLDRGFTYERASAELRALGLGPRERPTSRRERSSRARDEVSSDIQTNIALLERAVEAWRQLADERASEVAELREEVRQLRELLLAPRRPVALPRGRQRQA